MCALGYGTSSSTWVATQLHSVPDTLGMHELGLVHTLVECLGGGSAASIGSGGGAGSKSATPASGIHAGSALMGTSGMVVGAVDGARMGKSSWVLMLGSSISTAWGSHPPMSTPGIPTSLATPGVLTGSLGPLSSKSGGQVGTTPGVSLSLIRFPCQSVNTKCSG